MRVLSETLIINNFIFKELKVELYVFMELTLDHMGCPGHGFQKH